MNVSPTTDCRRFSPRRQDLEAPATALCWEGLKLMTQNHVVSKQLLHSCKQARDLCSQLGSNQWKG